MRRLLLLLLLALPVQAQIEGGIAYSVPGLPGYSVALKLTPEALPDGLMVQHRILYEIRVKKLARLTKKERTALLAKIEYPSRMTRQWEPNGVLFLHDDFGHLYFVRYQFVESKGQLYLVKIGLVGMMGETLARLMATLVKKPGIELAPPNPKHTPYSWPELSE